MQCFLVKLKTTNATQHTTKLRNGDHIELMPPGACYVMAPSFDDVPSMFAEGWVKSIEYVGDGIVHNG